MARDSLHSPGLTGSCQADGAFPQAGAEEASAALEAAASKEPMKERTLEAAGIESAASGSQEYWPEFCLQHLTASQGFAPWPLPEAGSTAGAGTSRAMRSGSLKAT